MADQTLDQLPEELSVQDTDLLYVVRGGTTDVKMKRAVLIDGLVPEDRTVTVGSGLSGGGALDDDITVGLNVSGLTESLSPVAAADYVLIHETSSGQPRKVRLDRLPQPTTSQNTFLNVAVSGQSTIVADGATDTLTVASGANIAITTNSATDTLTIAATGLAPTTRNIGAGSGLSGGGTLAADRSLALDINGQAEDVAPTLANHYLVSYDSSSGALRKLRASLLGGGSSYVLPKASGSVLGGVQVGSGLAIDNNGTLSLNYTIPAATSVSLGAVRVGANLSIDGSGVLSANAPYALPVATPSVLGGVRVGTGLAVDGAGVLSATAQGGSSYTLPVATASTLGGVRQGANTSIAGDGTISVAAPYSLPTASSGTIGGVRVGTGLAIDGSGILSVTSGDSYTLPAATSSVLGGVKIGSGVVVGGDGTISVPPTGGTPNDGVIRPTGVVKGSVSAVQRGLNRAAIQAAISTLNSQGSGKVALGGGRIEIDAQLTFSGGHNEGSFKQIDGEGCTLSMHGTTQSILRLDGCRHQVFRNFELVYGTAQTTGATFDWPSGNPPVVVDPHAAIRIRNSMFNRFENFVVRNAWIGICADTSDATGAAGGGSYSNSFTHIEINMAANTGWGFCQHKGTGSVINNMYITGNGQSVACRGGILLLGVGQSVWNQLNIEWLKCTRAMRLSNCYGIVINGMNMEGITPMPTNAGAAAPIHLDSSCTANFVGGTIADTRFDQTTNGVTNGVIFSIHSQSKLSVTGMHLSAVKKTGTVRTILLGCDNALNVTMDGAFATFDNFTLRRAGTSDHFNLNDLVVHPAGDVGGTVDGPLRRFNNVIGGISTMKTWTMASGVPSGDPDAPSPPAANVLYLAKHGPWQRFTGATASNLTLTLSNKIDVPMRDSATYVIPAVPPGAIYRITRGASASGTGILTVNNHNATAITTLTVGQTGEFFFDGTNWFLLCKQS